MSCQYKVVLLLIAFVSAGCEPQHGSDEKRKCDKQSQGNGKMRNDDEPSDDSQKLLAVLEDSKMPSSERVAAARKLGQRKEKPVVPRLIAQLPGRYDAVTYQVIGALEDIGDPRATQALEDLEPTAERNGIDIGGKMRAAIASAIRACERVKDKSDH